MAQPSGHPNILASIAGNSIATQGVPGVGNSPGPSLIPNGQPPQWNHPSALPHAVKLRPPSTGSHVATSITSNGTPTPPSYSHPGSLSSHSSRDPSPIPPNRHAENLYNSSPNLVMSNSQPPLQRSHPHQQSPSPAMNMSLQRSSSGMVLNTSQPRIMQQSVGKSVSAVHNSPVISPSLVTQNSGQSKSVGGLQSAPGLQLSGGGPFPSVRQSNLTVVPNSRHVPRETGSCPVNYSQEVVSQSFTSQNIPSLLNQSSRQQRLGTSCVPPDTHPHNSGPSSNQQKSDGRVGPTQDLPAGLSYAPPHMQTSLSVPSGPPLQQPLSQQGTGMPHQNMQGQSFTVASPVPVTNAQSFVPNQQMNRPTSQSGPGFGMLPMPGPPVGSHVAHQLLQPSPGGQNMMQSGILSQPGMPPVSGDVQKSLPVLGYTQPPVTNQFSAPQVSTTHHDSSQHMGKRYPQQLRSQTGGDILASQMSRLSVTQLGFNKLWGMECIDLLQNRNVLPAEKVEPPKIRLHQEFLDSVNCSAEIFRCTLTKVPETSSLLQKSRLPLGILIHPFKDLNHLPVIQCSTIVRCRSCRTYINPFVYFVDNKRWKCNLCFKVNELPEEFQYDPVSKTYGDPTRRPEIKSSTIEFIAPSEYMLRPPQPAVYLFLLDVSRLGVECGYLRLFCDILLEELDKLPGDGRTQIGFITYDSSVHFYSLAEGLSQPQQMIVVDTDDVFLPCPDNLLVNLAESRELVKDLLNQLPTKFLNSHDTNSSLGPALQAAFKLMAPTGGRVTVFQSCCLTMALGY